MKKIKREEDVEDGILLRIVTVFLIVFAVLAISIPVTLFVIMMRN